MSDDDKSDPEEGTSKETAPKVSLVQNRSRRGRSAAEKKEEVSIEKPKSASGSNKSKTTGKKKKQTPVAPNLAVDKKNNGTCP